MMLLSDLRLNYINRRSFIEGQLKLYKCEFVDTQNEKYLEVMNELNKTCEFMEHSINIMESLFKENNRLNNELNEYNFMTKEEFNHITLLRRGEKFKINDKEFQCVNLGYDTCISSKKKTQGWYIKTLYDNGNTYFYSFEELYNKIKKFKNENKHLYF